MARRTVLVSDLSGEEIPDGRGATVTISFHDARKETIVLDVSESEAEQMGAKGRKLAKRGRRPRKIDPSTYVEEVPSAPRPIGVVGTSVAARQRSSSRSR
jgi:hypothetical protein